MTSFGPFRLGRLIQPIAVYRGKGNLFVDAEKGPDCEFLVAQWPDANIQLECVLNEPSKDLLILTERKPSHLLGKIANGMDVEVLLDRVGAYSSSLTSSGEMYLCYLAQNLSVSVPHSSDLVRKLRFGLTNFELPVHKVTLQVPRRDVIVERVQGYKERSELVKSLRGIDVLSELSIEIYPDEELEEIKELADNLCCLFSLARGIKINWIYYQAFDERGDIVGKYQRNVVVKPYSPFRLIARGRPHDLKEFVEQTYPSFRKLKDRWLKDCCPQQPNSWWFCQAVDALADAKLEQDFLELRGLKLASLLEFIRSIYLEDTDKKYIVPKDEFERNYRGLKRDVKQVLKSYFPEQTAKMCSHVQGFKWTTFRQTVREMTEELGLSVSKDERDKLVKYRNNLVHRMSFFDEDEETSKDKRTEEDAFQAYRFMMSFVEKLLLAVLRYQGCYLDWTKHATWESDMRTPLSLDVNKTNWPAAYK